MPSLNNASGGSTQGASTITQQYVKILYLTQEQTYERKLKEAILSLRWSQVDLKAGLINFNPPGRQQTNKRRPRVPRTSSCAPTDASSRVRAGAPRSSSADTARSEATERARATASSRITLAAASALMGLSNVATMP